MSSAVMLKFGSTFSLYKQILDSESRNRKYTLGTLQDNSDHNNLGLLPTRPTRDSVGIIYSVEVSINMGV